MYSAVRHSRGRVSKHPKRNIRLAKIAYGKVKDIERSLQAILVAVMQIRKDFAKRTILTAHNGINFFDMKDHGYTFTTKNYACVVRANTYTVAPCLTAW